MKAQNLVAAVVLGLWFSPAAVAQQPAIISKPVAEKRVNGFAERAVLARGELPRSRRRRRPSLHSLALEAFGKVWLFTLGQQGQGSAGGVKVADIGPLPQVTAPQYLLSVNEGNGVPGSTIGVHTHPGSEASYVLSGEANQKTPHGVSRISTGQALAGPWCRYGDAIHEQRNDRCEILRIVPG
jgi:hypothetical protein